MDVSGAVFFKPECFEVKHLSPQFKQSNLISEPFCSWSSYFLPFCLLQKYAVSFPPSSSPRLVTARAHFTSARGTKNGPFRSDESKSCWVSDPWDLLTVSRSTWVSCLNSLCTRVHANMMTFDNAAAWRSEGIWGGGVELNEWRGVFYNVATSPVSLPLTATFFWFWERKVTEK